MKPNQVASQADGRDRPGFFLVVVAACTVHPGNFNRVQKQFNRNRNQNQKVDSKSNQIKSNQIKSNQIKSNQIKSNRTLDGPQCRPFNKKHREHGTSASSTQAAIEARSCRHRGLVPPRVPEEAGAGRENMARVPRDRPRQRAAYQACRPTVHPLCTRPQSSGIYSARGMPQEARGANVRSRVVFAVGREDEG